MGKTQRAVVSTIGCFFRAQNFATKQPPIRGNTGSIRGVAGPLRVTPSFFGSNLGSLLKDKINQLKAGFPRTSFETTKEAFVDNSHF